MIERLVGVILRVRRPVELLAAFTALALAVLLVFSIVEQAGLESRLLQLEQFNRALINQYHLEVPGGPTPLPTPAPTGTTQPAVTPPFGSSQGRTTPRASAPATPSSRPSPTATPAPSPSPSPTSTPIVCVPNLCL